MIDLGNIKTRLLTFGAMAAAGTYAPSQDTLASCATQLGLPAEIAGASPLLASLAAVAGAITASDIVQHINERRKHGEPLLSNHDLTHLVGHAIQSALDSVATKQDENREAKSLLRKLAKGALAQWENMASWNRTELAALAERNIPKLFKGNLEDILKQGVLTKRQWFDLLSYMAMRGKLTISTSILEQTSDYLANNFGRHLYELFKADVGQAKAYRALHILMISELREELQKQGASEVEHFNLITLRLHALQQRSDEQHGELLRSDQQTRRFVLKLARGLKEPLLRIEGHLDKIKTGSPKEQAPEILTIAPLPTMSSRIFGRETNFSNLTDNWRNPSIRITWLYGLAGVGKTGLIEGWLHRFISQNDANLERVIIHSFYKQGVAQNSVTSEPFLYEALRLLRDPKPTAGMLSERGIRLAELLQKKKTLLILDGLETLQEETKRREARLRDSGMLGLLSRLALVNTGLCVATSRFRLEELKSREGASVIVDNLEGIAEEKGAELLASLDVHGPVSELKMASKKLGGHCLALNLLGSFLRDTQEGDIRAYRRMKLFTSGSSAVEHARRIMHTYEQYLDPESLALLRLVSLFDRPVERDAIEALLRAEALPGLTVELQNSAKTLNEPLIELRNACLLNREDRMATGSIDCHPLVREYFAERTVREFNISWKKANLLLCSHFSMRAQAKPSTPPEMETLCRAIIHGCAGGDYHRMLHELYLPRMMRGEKEYAVNTLGMLGSVVMVLGHFFEDSQWKQPVPSLSKEDKILLLQEAGRWLTASKGYAATSVGECYRAALKVLGEDAAATEKFDNLLGLCRHHRLRGELKKSATLSKQLCSLAEIINTPQVLSAAERAISTNYFYTGNFSLCAKHAALGAISYPSSNEALKSAHRDLNEPGLSCRGYQALASWFLGDLITANEESIRVKKSALGLQHGHTTAILLLVRAMINQFQGNLAGVKTEAGQMFDLCTENGYSVWQLAASILLSWEIIRSGGPLGETLSKMDDLIFEWQRADARLFLPYWHGLKADAALCRGELNQAKKAIEQGLSAAFANGEHWWAAELYRLRVELAAIQKAGSQSIQNSLLLALKMANRSVTQQLQILNTQRRLLPETEREIRNRAKTLFSSIKGENVDIVQLRQWLEPR